MLTRLAARVAQGAAVVLVAASLTFLLLKLAPGDQFSDFEQGPGVTQATREFWRSLDGSNLPLAQQYGRWIGAVARGNLGTSSSKHQAVVSVLADAIPNTLLLMTLALASSVFFGVTLGAWQGAHAGSRRDRALSTLLLVVYSLPEFWLALALMIFFSTTVHWLPAGGMVSNMYEYMSPMAQLRDRLSHLVLPWFTLTCVGTAIFARYQRAAMRDIMREPFVRTARAKGLAERVVRRRHALRASLLPVITIGGLLFPTLVGGAVFVETIFSWPGMGQILVFGVGKRDYALVCGAVVAVSAMTAAGSLLAELLHEVADPRTRA